MNEREKYELVWSKVGRYGKDWTNPGLAGSIKRWIGAAIPRGSTVMDFGCGNGTSLAWLESVGYLPDGVEIAQNATTREGVIIGDLRDPLDLPESDYGICTDLMEHIPTVDVDRVLSLIAKTVRHSVLFVIARDEDKDGATVGQVLHLTRQNKAWWDARLQNYFDRLDVLHYQPKDESAYCLWAHK